MSCSHVVRIELRWIRADNDSDTDPYSGHRWGMAEHSSLQTDTHAHIHT